MAKSQNVVSLGFFFSGAGGILSTKALRDNEPSVRVLIPDQNKKKIPNGIFFSGAGGIRTLVQTWN